MKKTEWLSRTVTVLAGLMALLLFNLSVAEKEKLLADGKPILFELAPRDPRSLMQGDYMVLRYRLAETLESRPLPPQSHRGFLALKMEADTVLDGRFLNAASELGPGEILLEYKRVADEIKIGPESFFFQEGDAKLYEEAHYGELRIDENGKTLLVGLRDKEQKPLGKSLMP